MTATSPPAEPQAATLPWRIDESWTAYAAWLADELGWTLSFDGTQYRIAPARYEAEVAGEGSSGGSSGGSSVAPRRSWLRSRRPAPTEPKGPTADEAAFSASSPEEAIRGLEQRLARREAPPAFRPAEQPEAVHEISSRLFAAYTLDGGKAHISGCHFEDIPFVRSTRVEVQGGRPTAMHAFYDAGGAPVTRQAAIDLGLDRLEPLREVPQHSEAQDAAKAAAAAARLRASDEFVAVVLVKRASGRLRFEFGDLSLDQPFEGWARTLAPPPIPSPATGRPTFHLATYEGPDGLAIAASDEVGTSEATGRRLLQSDLERCAVSGAIVESASLTSCPVTRQRVAPERLVACPKCGQRVAPVALGADGCNCCRAGERVAPSDPRLARLAAKTPELRGRRWTLAESEGAYVLESAGWLRRRVVTIDKGSLLVTHRAERGRFAPLWRAVG